MKKTALLLKTGFCLLLLGLLGGLWYIKSQDFTHRAARMVAEEAANILQADIQIDTVEVKAVNELLINGIVIYDGQGGKLLEAEQAAVHFKPTALFGSQPLQAVSEVIVQHPQVKLVQRPDGSWNYQDIISGEKKEKSDFGGTLRLENGELDADATAGRLEISNINGTADFSRFPSVRVKGTFTQCDAQAEVSGAVGGQDQTLELKGENFAVEDYLPFIPAEKLQGISIKKGCVKKADISFSRQGSDPISVNGEVQLDGTEIEYMDKKAEDIKALLVFNEKELQLFAHGNLEEQPLSVHGKVHLDTEEPWLEVVAESDEFNPERIFTQSPFSGSVAFTADISGTFSQPEVHGVFKVKSGQIYNYPLQDAQVKASFKDNLLVIDEMTASVFGGKIWLAGKLDASDMKYSAHVKAENLKTESLPSSLTGLSGLLSADLGINGKGEELSTAEIYGMATLYSGSYQGIDIEQAEVSFYKQGESVKLDALSMSDQDKQAYYQQTQQRLANKEKDLIEPIRAKVQDAVKSVAEAKGLTVVLDKNSVVYGGQDITQDVIKKVTK